MQRETTTPFWPSIGNRGHRAEGPAARRLADSTGGHIWRRCLCDGVRRRHRRLTAPQSRPRDGRRAFIAGNAVQGMPMNTPLAHTVHSACMVLVDADLERSVIARLRENGALPRDVAIVDIRSHRRSGLATVHALRATRFAAALIGVGAFHSIDDRIALLDAGADQVLHGP